MKSFYTFLIFILSLLISCSPESNTSNGFCSDFDNDTICDSDEGESSNMDSDGDGIPDYKDADSDNDGIPDSLEAGDDDPSTAPLDSDSDGVPNHRDNDSDNNGIPDGIEGTGDIDGDGQPNFYDLDNDGDLILDETEIGGNPANPVNSDENSDSPDLIPDYNDTDSDNDGIGDIFETAYDSDNDGIPNYLDLDSDNDGISDKNESGTGGNPENYPADSDGDDHFDFVDADSDNDGLSDGYEDSNHNGILDPGESDPANPDTDGDGVSDLIEDAANTDPQDINDNPQAAGNFVFTVPFEETPTPTDDILNFSTNFQKLDLLFVEDVSGSLDTEINDVKNGLSSMLNSIVCGPGQTPAIHNCVPDVESGIIKFVESITLLKQIDDNNLTTDPGVDAQCTYNLLPSSTDSGIDEQQLSAMRYGISGSCVGHPDAANRFGNACFRNSALNLILLITDEPLTADYNYGIKQTIYNELIDAGIRVIVAYGDGAVAELKTDMSAAQSGGTNLVPLIDTSSISSIPACSGLGTGLFYNNQTIIDGAGTTAGAALTCAVQAVSSYLPQDVNATVINDPLNQTADGTFINAIDEFIDHIEVYMASGDTTCPDGYNISSTTYLGILPGDPVCWKIFVKENISVPASTEQPQKFRATVEVTGEGGAMLDSRDVWFLVPQNIEGPGAVE
jgi:hypothetical protein